MRPPSSADDDDPPSQFNHLHVTSFSNLGISSRDQEPKAHTVTVEHRCN